MNSTPKMNLKKEKTRERRETMGEMKKRLGER